MPISKRTTRITAILKSLLDEIDPDTAEEDRPTEIIGDPSPQRTLENLHAKLIVVFDKLCVVRDTAITCVTAAESFQFEGIDQLAKVIHNHIMLDVDEQLRAVTTCIELLGGSTEYSAGIPGPGDEGDEEG